MGRWYQVWMVITMVVIAVVPSLALGDELAGQLGDRGKEPSASAAPATAPRFSLMIVGSNCEMVQQGFLEYARAIDQKADLLTNGGRFYVILSEQTDTSRDAWGGIASELGNRVTRGQVRFDTGDRRVLTLRGEIREGNKVHFVYSTAKTGMGVRVDASVWSQWANAWGGRSNDPQQRLRVEAVRDLIPLLMAELQRIVIEDAKAQAQAAKVSGGQAVAGGRGTELMLFRGSRQVSFPVRIGDRLKVVKKGRRIGTMVCINTDVAGTQAWFNGSQQLLALAMDPTVTVQR